MKSSDSAIKETLKSICCSHGWSYGFFWGFDQSNSLLLTLKDAYYEENIQALAHNMLQQVHTLGGGLIGQVALSQNHRWIYSEAHQDMPDPYDQSQNDFEFFSQFILGIKTVALISVEPWGVLQFGSTEKIPEKNGFEDVVRKSFKSVVRTAQELNKHQDHPEQISAAPFGSMFSCEPNYSSAVDRVQPFSKLPTNDFDELLFEPSGFFNFSGPQTLNMDTDLSYQQAKFSPSLFDPTYGKDSRPISGLLTLDDLFQENDYCLIDDAARWSSVQNMSGHNSPLHMTNSIITSTMQSSITDTFGSSNNGKMLKRSELDRGCNHPTVQNDSVLYVDGLSFTTDVSRFVSEKNVGASNSLFSKLGLDQILDGVASFGHGSYIKTRFEDQLSSSAAKRRKTNSCSWIQCQEKAQNQVYNLEVKSEASTKEQAGSFITDLCSEKTSSSSKRQEEVTKSGKKKAKAGTKPRPKDRQMIQDRLAELRHLIPNGEKMSIDRLLERTIKHLNYMQSLTKHADVLKQTHKPKADALLKDNVAKGGATWAYEVGDQTMVCPLIVEDLNTPGQVLIEILCDEQGFFLEIADIIRSFGLTVLKGTMELRDTKIWAHFLAEAEANRRVTRHEIFSSLIQLLQMSVNNAADSNDRFGSSTNKSAITSEAFLFDNYDQTSVSFPMNMGSNPLHCASVRQCS